MAIPCAPARVVNVARLSPHLIRISFEAVGHWLWHVDGVGDERVDIALPHPGETSAVLDVFNLPEYGPAWKGEAPPWRHYTMRKVRDGGRGFDIEFVLHGHGIASTWAAQAQIGHVIGVFNDAESRAYYAPPAGTDVQILVVDATGLPGLGRILEGLDNGTRAIVIAEVAEQGDILTFTTRADVEYRWLIGSGGGVCDSALPSAVAELNAPDESWYAWVACEASASRAIRRDLRGRLGSPRDRHHVIGYWTRDRAGDHTVELS